MPVIIGDKVVNVSEPAKAPAPETKVVYVKETDTATANPNINIVVEHTTEEQKTLNRRYVIERNSLKGVASGDTSLVVNGKQKSIGRKSHYLLDMLTLDD